MTIESEGKTSAAEVQETGPESPKESIEKPKPFEGLSVTYPERQRVESDQELLDQDLSPENKGTNTVMISDWHFVHMSNESAAAIDAANEPIYGPTSRARETVEQKREEIEQITQLYSALEKNKDTIGKVIIGGDIMDQALRQGRELAEQGVLKTHPEPVAVMKGAMRKIRNTVGENVPIEIILGNHDIPFAPPESFTDSGWSIDNKGNLGRLENGKFEIPTTWDTVPPAVRERMQERYPDALRYSPDQKIHNYAVAGEIIRALEEIPNVKVLTYDNRQVVETQLADGRVAALSHTPAVYHPALSKILWNPPTPEKSEPPKESWDVFLAAHEHSTCVVETTNPANPQKPLDIVSVGVAGATARNRNEKHTEPAYSMAIIGGVSKKVHTVVPGPHGSLRHSRLYKVNPASLPK